VEAQEVIHGERETRGRREEVEGVVRAMPVVIVKEEGEAVGAVSRRGIRVSVGPFAERGLNEALGLAVGFWRIRSSEAMFETEGGDGQAHGARAVARAIVWIDALRKDAVAAEEGEWGMKESNGALGALVWEELCEREARMVIDGDVEILPTGALGLTVRKSAGDARARADDAGELLDIKMDEFPRGRAFVATDGQRRFQCGEPSGVAAEEPRDGSLGKLGGACDLEAWEFAAAQGQHPRDTQRMRGRRRRSGLGRAVP
jgi:hypothetical protein